VADVSRQRSGHVFKRRMSSVTGHMYLFNKTGNVRINVTVRRVRVTTVAVEKQ
jgi:L-lactate utilization protein LutB